METSKALDRFHRDHGPAILAAPRIDEAALAALLARRADLDCRLAALRPRPRSKIPPGGSARRPSPARPEAVQAGPDPVRWGRGPSPPGT